MSGAKANRFLLQSPEAGLLLESFVFNFVPGFAHFVIFKSLLLVLRLIFHRNLSSPTLCV